MAIIIGIKVIYINGIKSVLKQTNKKETKKNTNTRVRNME